MEWGRALLTTPPASWPAGTACPPQAPQAFAHQTDAPHTLPTYTHAPQPPPLPPQVTTIQMFKILGLLCLSSAYSYSVMYMDGIKLGDTQVRVVESSSGRDPAARRRPGAACQLLLLAGCRSMPLTHSRSCCCSTCAYVCVRRPRSRAC